MPLALDAKLTFVDPNHDSESIRDDLKQINPSADGSVN